MADKHYSRIRRQFEAFGRAAPPSRPIINPLLEKRMWWVRVPVALLLMVGGVFSFLPVLGLWMLPLGLLLLALDIPLLRPGVARTSIWTRRRIRRWRRRRDADTSR